MRIATYYKTCPPDQAQLGCSMYGLGARKYWETAIGVALPQAIAQASQGQVHYALRQWNWDLSLERIVTYPIFHSLQESDDISYCEVFDVPERRPDGFVYGLVDDVIGREEQLEFWLEHVRPDVLFPTHDPRPEVGELCRKYGCKCEFLPWFIESPQPYCPDKTITAMSTGAIGYPCYPTRTKIIEFMAGLNRSDCIVGGTNDQTKYALTAEQYEKAVAHTKYYVTAGTWDFELPAKCIEVMNAGACLVCPQMPAMPYYGFEDGVNYIRLDEVQDIPAIIDSNRWETIAPAGQRWVQEHHTVTQRARQIIGAYEGGV